MQRILIKSLSVIAVCLAVVQAMAAEKNAKSANDEQIIRQLMQEWAEALVKGVRSVRSRSWEPQDRGGSRSSRPRFRSMTTPLTTPLKPRAFFILLMLALM